MARKICNNIWPHVRSFHGQTQPSLYDRRLLGFEHLEDRRMLTSVSVSLNLEFNDHTDFGSGGVWTAVAKADSRGISAIILNFEKSSLNFNPSNGFLTPAGFEIESYGEYGNRLEILLADNTINPTLDVGVIGGTYPSNYVDNPGIQVLGSNPDLGSFTGGVALATGTFDAGDIPTWYASSPGPVAGNLFVDASGTVSEIIDVNTTVRFVDDPFTQSYIEGVNQYSQITVEQGTEARFLVDGVFSINPLDYYTTYWYEYSGGNPVLVDTDSSNAANIFYDPEYTKTFNQVGGPFTIEADVFKNGTYTNWLIWDVTVVPAKPDLTPYQPSGWDDKIVISTNTGDRDDDSPIFSDENIYIDWAVINDGNGPTTSDYLTSLYLDGNFVASWNNTAPQNVNNYKFVSDYNLGSLAAGSHTIEIRADYTNVINEVNDSSEDNNYSRSFTVYDRPDLIVESVTDTLISYDVGDKIQARATIKNVGGYTANASDLKYYLGTADGSNKTYRYIEQGSIGSLAANATAEDIINFPYWTIPIDVATGEYRIWVQADSSNDVYEGATGGNNNWGSSEKFVITVEPFIIEGQVTYREEGQTVNNAAYVHVEVYEKEAGIDYKIAEGSTNSLGRFSFTHDINGNLLTLADVELGESGTRDIYFKVYPKNEAVDVVIPTAVPGVTQNYEYESSVSYDVTGPTHNALLYIADTSFTPNHAGAYGLPEYYKGVRDWFASIAGGWSRDQVTLAYNSPTSAYSAVNELGIELDTIYLKEGASPFTMAHEYGHAIQYVARGRNGANPGTGTGPYPHPIYSEVNAEFAMTEGWADFIGFAANNDDLLETNYLWMGSDGWNDKTNDNQNSGEIVEGAVASVFWDIYDSPANDDDAIDGEFSKLWNILLNYDPDYLWRTPSGPSNFLVGDGFYNYWTNQYGLTSDIANVFIDHGMAVWDDAAEQNDTSGSAYVLSNLNANYQGLLLSDEFDVQLHSEEDWFTFSLTQTALSGSGISVTATGHGNPDLYVYDASLALFGESTEGIGDPDSVDLSGLQAGAYNVKVVGYGGDLVPGYELSLDIQVDNVSPQAHLNASDVTVAGGTSHPLAVLYTDNIAVDISDLDSNDLVVQLPSGPGEPVSFVGVDIPVDFPFANATYSFDAPGGTWDRADNGTYNVWMQFEEVSDTSEVNYVTAGLLGSFEVNIPNQNPSADIGDPYLVAIGDSIILDASDSDDPDGNIVSYLWDLDNDGQFDDGSGVKPSYTPSSIGKFDIGLRVVDNEGAFDDDFTTLTVYNPDLTGDGFVDSIDLGVLLGNWGAFTSPIEGELNGIFPVDSVDLGLLLGAWDPPPALATISDPDPFPNSELTDAAMANARLDSQEEEEAYIEENPSYQESPVDIALASHTSSLERASVVSDEITTHQQKSESNEQAEFDWMFEELEVFN